MLNCKSFIDMLSPCKAYYEAPNRIIFERWVLKGYGGRKRELCNNKQDFSLKNSCSWTILGTPRETTSF